MQAKALRNILLLIVLGIAANYLRMPLLFGVDFFFGSIFTLVAAALYGPLVGAAVSIAVSAVTLTIAAHPFFIIIGVAEALMVGYLVRRYKGGLLLGAAVFWLIPGALLDWIFYNIWMNSSATTTLMAWMKHTVNGISNALIADLILIGFGFFARRNLGRPRLTFQQVFFTMMVALVLFPAVALLIVTSRSKMMSIETELVEKTHNLSRTIDALITGWQRARFEGVTQLSEVAAERGTTPSSRLDRDVRVIANATSGFQGMIVTDTAGRVVSSYVSDVPDSTAIIGTSYADRTFFQDLISGREDIVSDVIVSRGLRSVPIVTFAKPVMKDDKIIGIAAGAADLTNLRDALIRYSTSAGTTITIIDRTGQVVASTDDMIAPMDVLQPPDGDIFTLDGEGSYHRLPAKEAFVPSITRWSQSVFGTSLKSSELPWTIKVEASLRPYSLGLQKSHIESFGLMIALCIGGLGISFLLTRWIGRPITRLAEVTGGMPTQVEDTNRISWPSSPMRELAILIENFKIMTSALRTRFHELQVEIAERTKAQEKLQEATAAAERASSAKGEFLANMSHEIRTPLGAVLGFAELMTNEDLNARERQECVQAIKRNGEQLFRLIDDVLDFSKVEAGHIKLEPTTISFDEILRGSADILKPLATEKGLVMSFEGESALPATMTVDPTRLKQIILNVIGNAIKFTDSGSIDVTFSFERSADLKHGVLTITVQDSGVGIAPEDASKLFHAFGQIDSSSNRRYGGTGLGLVLSRRIAQAMGGDVTLVTSGEAEGCCFEIKVQVGMSAKDKLYPTLAEARKGGNLLVQSTGKAKPLIGLSLLVVEDAPDNRLLFKRALTALGASVDVAESGAQGVQMASTKEFDVILMDVQMPEIDGLEATRILRNNGYSKPIAALTAHALQEDRRRCLEAGLDEYLAKPVDWKRLTEVVLSLSRQDKKKDPPASKLVAESKDPRGP